MASSLGFTCHLPPGNSDGLYCLFFILLLNFLSSPSFPLSPSVTSPWGSFLQLPDVQAGFGMEAEAFFLLAFQEGKKLAIWAAVAC